MPNVRAERIAVGGYHTCARLADGSVRCWGNNESGQLGASWDERPKVVKVGDYVELALGPSHTCARSKDGIVSCWGGNARGELGDGTTTSRSSPAPIVFSAK